MRQAIFDTKDEQVGFKLRLEEIEKRVDENLKRIGNNSLNLNKNFDSLKKELEKIDHFVKKPTGVNEKIKEEC